MELDEIKEVKPTSMNGKSGKIYVGWLYFHSDLNMIGKKVKLGYTIIKEGEDKR